MTWLDDIRQSTSAVDIEQVDISEAISRLNSGIDTLDTRLAEIVAQNYAQLLDYTNGAVDLTASVDAIRDSVAKVERSVDRIDRKIRGSHADLRRLHADLTRHHRLMLLSSDVHRYIVLARKLAHGGRTLPEMASLVAELVKLVNRKPQLANVALVRDHHALVDRTRANLMDKIRSQFDTGLASKDLALVVSAFKLSHHLGVLSTLVSDQVNDMLANVSQRIRATWDMDSLAKEVAARSASASFASRVVSSRVPKVPTPATFNEWALLFWARIEKSLTNDLLATGTQCDLIARALSDTDPSLGFYPVRLFLSEVTDTFSSAVDNCRSSSFIAMLMSAAGYPRLLRNAHIIMSPFDSPQAVIAAFKPFEAFYIARLKRRLDELHAILHDQPYRPDNPRDKIPSEKTADIARVIVNELDIARSDIGLYHAACAQITAHLDRHVASVTSLLLNSPPSPAAFFQSAPLPLPDFLKLDFINGLPLLGKPISLFLDKTRSIAESGLSGTQSSSAFIDPLYDKLLALENLHSSALASFLSSAKEYLSSCIDARVASPSLPEDWDISSRLTDFALHVLSFKHINASDFLGHIARLAIRRWLVLVALSPPPSEDLTLRLVSDASQLEFATSQLLAHIDLTLSDAAPRELAALQAFRRLLVVPLSEISSPLWSPVLSQTISSLGRTLFALFLLSHSDAPAPYDNVHRFTDLVLADALDLHASPWAQSPSFAPLSRVPPGLFHYAPPPPEPQHKDTPVDIDSLVDFSSISIA